MERQHQGSSRKEVTGTDQDISTLYRYMNSVVYKRWFSVNDTLMFKEEGDVCNEE